MLPDGEEGVNLTSPADMQELELVRKRRICCLLQVQVIGKTLGFCGDFERTLWKFNREIGLGTQ